jgi:hypothetical protein
LSCVTHPVALLRARQIGVLSPLSPSASPPFEIFCKTLLNLGYDAVNFGKEFIRYEQTPNGKVTAFFADGTTAAGHVLVGADGTGSNVRKQYLPHAQIVDTGIVGAADQPRSPGTAARSSSQAANKYLAPNGAYMIVTQSIYRSEAKYTDPVGDHLIWVLVSSRAPYGDADPKAMDGESIRRLALRMTDNWHPVLRNLIADSDPIRYQLFRKVTGKAQPCVQRDYGFRSSASMRRSGTSHMSATATYATSATHGRKNEIAMPTI